MLSLSSGRTWKRISTAQARPAENTRNASSAADGHYYEVYDDETAIQIMEEIKSLADSTIGSLQELLDSDILSIEDFNYINEIISVFSLLYKEAESYQGFVQTGEEKQANL